MATTKKPENRVPLLVPDIGTDEEDIVICDDGKNYLIKRGETVMVPPSVKEIYDRSERMKKAARENRRRFEDNMKEAAKNL